MTTAEFKLLYPEFATELDARVQYSLDEAVAFLDQCRWACWYEKGLGLYVAHQIAMGNQTASNGSGAPGDAGVSGANDWTSKRVGDVAITKSDSISQDQAKNPFMRSTYGQQWLYYQRLAGTGAVAV